MNATDLELGLLGDVGTLAWARRGHGLLTDSERRRYIAAAVAESARSMPRLLALKFGKAGKRRATITENDLLLPDVAPAAAIIAKCSGVMTASVVEHSYRSYVYAKALGRAGWPGSPSTIWRCLPPPCFTTPARSRWIRPATAGVSP
jgi:hypothetical protein